jgi:hypothetical protein
MKKFGLSTLAVLGAIGAVIYFVVKGKASNDDEDGDGDSKYKVGDYLQYTGSYDYIVQVKELTVETDGTLTYLLKWIDNGNAPSQFWVQSTWTRSVADIEFVKVTYP